MDSSDRVEMCLQHADIQDNLLQNYRNFLITIESVLLAVGAVLLTGVFSLNKEQMAVSAGSLVLLGTFSIWIIRKGQDLVRARGRDVSYWHVRALEFEQDLDPESRLFTGFKLHQKKDRRGHDEVVDDWFEKFEDGEPLSNKEVHEVVHHGLSHTRNVVDTLIPRGLKVAWILLLLIGVGVTAFRYLA